MDLLQLQGTCESLYWYPGRSRSSKNANEVRLGNADDLEETSQECENMEVREAHASMGSSKFRQLLSSSVAQMPVKPARAVRAIHVESESSGIDVDSSGSDNDSD